MRGNIKHWSERGFGFITNPNGGADIFVHASDVQNVSAPVQLSEGDVVVFEIGPGKNGKTKAVEVYLQ